tara:strand:- start:1864 stop:2253 length:390 start_codon:yes stop_codon:yes gene_type:complete
MTIAIGSARQLLNLWTSSLAKRGVERGMRKTLEKAVGERAVNFHHKAIDQLSPKVLIKEIKQVHDVQRIPYVLPKVSIQETAGQKLQATARQARNYTKGRLANKQSESPNQTLRRLGFKPKKDPGTTKY